MTNDIIAHHGVDLVLVPEAEIRLAVREAAGSNGLVLEGSAATPYAAIATGLVGDTVAHRIHRQWAQHRRRPARRDPGPRRHQGVLRPTTTSEMLLPVSPALFQDEALFVVE